MRFLASYLSSLYTIKYDPHTDPIKGKAVVGIGLKTKHPIGCFVDEVEDAQWAAPDIGRVKLNTDASVIGVEAGVGMILRDHEGSIVFTSCRHLQGCSDVLEAELLALREGISLALQWSNLPLDIESDCLEAVTMVNGGT